MALGDLITSQLSIEVLAASNTFEVREVMTHSA